MTAERAAYTAEEVAEMLGWTRWKVYDHAKHDPAFPCLRSGRSLLFPRRRFDHWLNGGMEPTTGVVVESARIH